MQTYKFFLDKENVNIKELDHEVSMLYSDEINEVLLTFNKKAYPKDGNILIMSGGAGSGKGHVLKNIVGLEGKVFNVDELKNLSSKLPDWNEKLIKELKLMYSMGTIDKLYTIEDLRNIKNLLKNPDIVKASHSVIVDMKLGSKSQENFFLSLQNGSGHKPNIIFDVTLASMEKLFSITANASRLGYDKKSIHIVWVVNRLSVAREQNLKRSRTVPDDILLSTHKGSSRTMSDIIKMGAKLKKYMDGDIYLVFNQIGIDSGVSFGNNDNMVVDEVNYIKIKEAGKTINSSAITKKVRKKIISYVPKDTFMV